MRQERSIALVILAVAAAPVASLASGVAPAAATGGTVPYFVDAAAEAGLDFTCEHWHKALGLAPRWFNDILFCASPVLADFNGDGYTDAYFPNQRYSNVTLNAERDPQDRLFLNGGDGTFDDVTALVGIHDDGYSMGAAPIDYDGDGDLDVYVAAYAIDGQGMRGPSTIFYENGGDGTFTRRDTATMGLVTGPVFDRDDAQFGMAVAVADYDADGDLDLYRGNYIRYRLAMGMPPALQLTMPDTNVLYRNEGDGTFVDATIESGASLHEGRTFSVNFADFNGDGRPDLYVANDENPNELYLNDGDGTFTDAGAASRAADPRGSMCSETADFDGDGDLDLYMSQYEDELNGYYLGAGDGTFTDASTLGDLDLSFHVLGWACPALDVDNDGDLDLFVANGHMLPTGGEFRHPGDPLDDNGYALPNFLFRNTLRETGEHSWTEIHARAGPGMADRLVSSGASAADLDLDGRVDLVVVNNNDAKTNLYKNIGVGSGHWLSITLRQPGANAFAIGATVTVEAGGLRVTQQRIVGRTLGSGGLEPLHVGLGGRDGPVHVTVRWPYGPTESWTVAEMDRPLRIERGRGVVTDTLAPRPIVTVDGVAGDDGWWTSPSVEVSIDAPDVAFGTPSGRTALQYRLDGGAARDYEAPLTISGEGRHRLVVLTADAAGNAAWFPHEIAIDSNAPTTAIARPVRGMVHVQDRVVAESPTGDTVVIAPARTPEHHVARADGLASGTARSFADRFGAPDLRPASASGAFAARAGSDGYARIVASAADATSGVREVAFAISEAGGFLDRAPPYEWEVDLRALPPGWRDAAIVTRDAAGNVATDALRILVVPTAQDGYLNAAGGGA